MFYSTLKLNALHSPLTICLPGYFLGLKAFSQHCRAGPSVQRVSPCTAMSEQGKPAQAEPNVLQIQGVQHRAILEPTAHGSLSSSHLLTGQQGARVPTAGACRSSCCFEETQTYGSLIQTQTRAPSPLVHSNLWNSHSSQVSPNSPETQDIGSTLLASLISLSLMVPGAGGRINQEVIFLIPWGTPERRSVGTLSPGNTRPWVWLHTLSRADLSSTHSWPICVPALSVPSTSCFLLLKDQKIKGAEGGSGGGRPHLKTNNKRTGNWSVFGSDKIFSAHQGTTAGQNDRSLQERRSS